MNLSILNNNRSAVLLALGLFLSGSNIYAQTCHYALIDPGTGKVDNGKFAIDLGEGDGTEKPVAWIGPMKISQSGGLSCSVDQNVSIMERPIYADGQHLLVTTYSGGNQTVFAVDAASCKVLWTSSPFSGEVSLKGKVLHMGKQTVKLGVKCTP